MTQDDSAPRLAPRESHPRPSAAGAKRVGPPAETPGGSGGTPGVTPGGSGARPGTTPGASVPERQSIRSAPPTIAPGGAPVAFAPAASGTPQHQPAPQYHAGPAQAPRVGTQYPPAHTHAPQYEAGPVQAPRVGKQNSKRTPRAKRVLGILLALILAWPVGLMIWANSQINRTAALSDARNTPGTTYLLVGSDSRADGPIGDDTEGQRSDTIIVLHRARNGQTAMISLPRDTLVTIPGVGDNKLNASYAIGGPQLLVQTVEGLTGLTVDHYVEIGMGGVVSVVDAVGGVELCLDYDVNDPLSELVWTAGCHTVDGRQALAFARMRHSDPMGDIGRAARQRQVIAATVRAAATPSTAFNPLRQAGLVSAGVNALTVGEGTNILNLGMLGLAFVRASGDSGFTGAPPIASMGHDAGSIGSVVLLADSAPDFFARLASGKLTPEDFPH